jgi:hypothetical protein
MNPVATSDAAFRGGACPTPEYTIAYTGNYTTSADANHWILRAVKEALAIGVLATMGLLILYLAVQRLQRDYQETRSSRNETQRDQ